MTEELDDVKGLTSVFPYVMLLSAFFATGFVFLSVNLPLLLECARGRQSSDFYSVLLAIPEFWRGVLHKDVGIGVLLFYCLAALVVGFLVHPPALVLATFLGKFVSWVAGVLLRRPTVRVFYAPPVFFETRYAATARWFYRNRQAKVHYEWELFNYYLYAGISLNLIVGAGVLWKLSAASWLPGAALVCVCLSSLAYCLARSAVVEVLYEYYSDKACSTRGEDEAAEGGKPHNGTE
ncbi:MAG: hypothetical protein AAB403_11400 [Planctomycetota bacterium]